MKYVVAYFSTAAVFLLIDIVWLSVVANRFYRQQLGELLLKNPNYAAAAGFYLMYIAGIVFFAVQPAFENKSILTAVIYGALFGFFTYATYDMTNLATLKGWPWTLAVVDMAWGTALGCLSATGGYLVTSRFFTG